MTTLGIKKFTPVFSRTRRRYISHSRQWLDVPLYRRGFCHWRFSIEDWIQHVTKRKFMYFLLRLRRRIAGQLEMFSNLKEQSHG